MMPPEHDFKKIYAEYFQRIVQYLTRIVGSNDAEDIAQDVFDKINSVSFRQACLTRDSAMV